MRRLLLSLLALASFAAAASAQSFSSQDTVAYATATIRVREQPAVTAEAVAILGQGTRVRLYHCSEGWCGVSIQKLAGYALEEYLTAKSPRQVATAPTQQMLMALIAVYEAVMLRDDERALIRLGDGIQEALRLNADYISEDQHEQERKV